MGQIYLICAFLLLSHGISAQLGIDWQQCYCSMDLDKAYGVAKIDGGYLVAGTILGGGGQVTCTNKGAAWLLRIDEEGRLIWQKCFEHAGTVGIKKIGESQNYYLIGQALLEPYPEKFNLWFAKIDSSGTIIWETVKGTEYGLGPYGGASGLVSTTDGGVIGTRIINRKGGDITNWYGSFDGWIIKLDSLGNKQWDLTIGTENSEFIDGIIQTNDNGYLALLSGAPDGITGNISCQTNDALDFDAIIYKIDSVGNPQWHKCYGGSDSDVATRAINMVDGFLIGGDTWSWDGDLEGSGQHGGGDIWLLRTGLLGQVIWEKCYGGSKNDALTEILQTSDGGFMVFGNTHSFDGDVVGNPSNSSAVPSIWVFKVDSMGNMLWQQCIGGHGVERVHGVLQETDHKYVVAGEMTYSPSADVDCSNFIYGSFPNYWVFGISDTTVQVAEESLIRDKQPINIYPNPASNSIKINTNEPITSVVVIDLYGLKQQVKFLKQDMIDISFLNKGMYIVIINEKHGIKFIKN
jgi:hypothetical protein